RGVGWSTILRTGNTMGRDGLLSSRSAPRRGDDDRGRASVVDDQVTRWSDTSIHVRVARSDRLSRRVVGATGNMVERWSAPAGRTVTPRSASAARSTSDLGDSRSGDGSVVVAWVTS